MKRKYVRLTITDKNFIKDILKKGLTREEVVKTLMIKFNTTRNTALYYIFRYKDNKNAFRVIWTKEQETIIQQEVFNNSGKNLQEVFRK